MTSPANATGGPRRRTRHSYSKVSSAPPPLSARATHTRRTPPSSWTNAGEAVPFIYVPATAETALSVEGNVIVDPMSIGTSDGEFGDVLTSDVEWACVGKPDVTWSTVAAAATAQETTRTPEPAAT